MSADHPPLKLNILIFLAAASAYIYSLHLANTTESVYIFILCCILFAYVGNTLFCLMHEAVHNCFSSSDKINTTFGIATSIFQPTSFTAQKHFHLGHHERNRSDLESWDTFLPDDNRFLKRIQWYTILTGIYWTSSISFGLLYLFCPFILNSSLLKGESKGVKRLGAEAMLEGLTHPIRVRFEIFLSFSFQIALIYFLELSLLTCLCCYGTFAWMWSSLQYADHAFTPRDRINGAWNLKVFPWTKWFFLNYHSHLAHHQNPSTSWMYLDHYIKDSVERPWFWSIYLKMWKGPVEAK